MTFRRRKNPFHEQKMSGETLTAMRDLVREAALPMQLGDKVKTAIARAARRLGLPPSRAHSYWCGKARSVPAEEWIVAQEAMHALRRAEAERLAHRLAEINAKLHGDSDAKLAMGSGSLGAGPARTVDPNAR